jgi:pentose-5-phosphate-3-epimerase
MIEEPEKYAEEFKRAGADGLTVHMKPAGICTATFSK